MYHQKKHSKRDCPQWVYAMNLMANWFLDEVSLTEQSSGSTVNIIDQDEVETSKEIAMFLWDHDLSMPPEEVFEVQEPPVEVFAVQM
jgi:hypothetical protein